MGTGISTNVTANNVRVYRGNSGAPDTLAVALVDTEGSYLSSMAVNSLPAIPSRPLMSSNTGAAGVAVTSTLAGAANFTTYLSQILVTTGTVALAIAAQLITITGLALGTLSLYLNQLTAQGTVLKLNLPFPLAASAQNTAISATLPAITGGAVTALTLFGFQQ